MKLPVPSVGDGFEKCPPGNHLAVCYEVIDLGTQETKYKDETKIQRKIWIGWETPNELMEDGRPFVIGRRYTLSGHEKSALRIDLESWRGKAFKDEDFGEGGFKIESVLGAACFLNVVHNENDGKTYANIKNVAALPKGTKPPELINEKVYLSLEPGEFRADVYQDLSERMRETIAKSPEYKAFANGTAEDDDSPF